MRYLIVVERSATGFSAWSPDLPGCAAVGATREKTELQMKSAIEFHIEGLKAEGVAVPMPSTSSAWVEVAA